VRANAGPDRRDHLFASAADESRVLPDEVPELGPLPYCPAPARRLHSSAV